MLLLKSQVSLNEPTASKKKNTGKQADLEKAILVHLLDDFSEKKATKALGYLLTVTTRDKIDERKHGVFLRYGQIENLVDPKL
nr:hypothetical protein [Tanacetum cinerariifolium]